MQFPEGGIIWDTFIRPCGVSTLNTPFSIKLDYIFIDHWDPAQDFFLSSCDNMYCLSMYVRWWVPRNTMVFVNLTGFTLMENHCFSLWHITHLLHLVLWKLSKMLTSMQKIIKIYIYIDALCR